MSFDRHFRLQEHFRAALWPVPVGAAIAGLLAGMIAWRLDHRFGWTLLSFEPDAATALTAAIVGATLTFLGTAFAVLLVVVQFANTQLTPRALRVSLSDPLYRVVLGLFIFTFVYAMIILARVTKTFVPQGSVILAAILIAVSLIAYVALISHLRRSVRPVIVASRTGALGRRAIEKTYPVRVGTSDRETLSLDRPVGEPTRILSNPGPPGTLVAFDLAGLVAEARRCRARVALVPAPGDFVRTGAPLFHLFEPEIPMNEHRLLHSVVLAPERTTDQDPAFAFRILVDIAVKALSPAINDPTSAVMAIDQLHELLADLGSRRLDVGQYRDAEGRTRLTVEWPSWEDYVSLAVDEIRRCGAEQLQVLRRLRALFDDLLQALPPDRRPAVQHELGLLAKAAERGFPDSEDRTRAGEPDPQGIGHSPALHLKPGSRNWT